MSYRFFNDVLLNIVVIFILSLAVSAVCILFLVLALRTIRFLKEERLRLVQERWSHVLAEAAVGVPVHLPKLLSIDQVPLLLLWNSFQEKLQGSSRDKMNEICKILGLDKKAKQMIKSRKGLMRVLAISTLGYLRDDADWEIISEIAKNNENIEGYVAALALVRINPKRSAHLVVDIVSSNHLWPLEQLAVLLEELSSENIGDLFVEKVLQAPQLKPRLIKLAYLSPREHTLRLLRHIFEKEHDPEILAAGLATVKQISGIEFIQEVRYLVFHPSWQVRVQAVNALAVIATRQDVEIFVRLLSDESWWVRYRSAQAIVWLPFLKKDEVVEICGKFIDRYGRDSLERNIAERQAREPTWQ